MRNLFKRLLGQVETVQSKDDAKNRLQVLLIHDAVDLTPAQLDQMRDEILEVVGRYVQIDPDGMEFRLDKEDGHIALVSNLPIQRVNNRAPATAGA